MSPLGFIILVFRLRRFNGSGTANDFNIVNPLGEFCGFFVFSSTRFNGILNLLFYSWWQFNSSCVSLALKLFWGAPPDLYRWIHLYHLGVLPYFYLNHGICFDMFLEFIYDGIKFNVGEIKLVNTVIRGKSSGEKQHSQ